MSPLPLLLTLGLPACMRPLPDPLAEQRAALAGLSQPSLPPDWAPHASLVLGRPLIDELLLTALERALGEGLAPASVSFFGLTATLAPRPEVRAARAEPSEACARCLALELELGGSAALTLENPTGRQTDQVDWSGRLRAVTELSIDREGHRLRATPAATERWEVALDLDPLPGGWNQAISEGLSGGLRQQLAAVEPPTVTLVTLQEELSRDLADLRLRPVGEHVAVDFGFLLPTAGEVDALPDPGAGWSAVLPEDTLLGLLQAEALRQPYDPEAPATPELLDLSLEDGGFTLALRAWPTRGRSGPRQVEVDGSVALIGDGALRVEATGARWVEGADDRPDLAVLLFGDRLLEAFTGGVAATLPAARERELAGGTLSAHPRALRVADGQLLVEGDLALSP